LASTYFSISATVIDTLGRLSTSGQRKARGAETTPAEETWLLAALAAIVTRGR
jgi:hypothetical protein